MPDTYRARLESGGYVEFKLDVYQNTKLKITISALVDSQNNEIPADADELNKYAIKVPYEANNAASTPSSQLRRTSVCL